MRVDFLAQGNNQSLWWGSNPQLTRQLTNQMYYQLYHATICAMSTLYWWVYAILSHFTSTIFSHTFFCIWHFKSFLSVIGLCVDLVYNNHGNIKSTSSTYTQIHQSSCFTKFILNFEISVWKIWENDPINVCMS